MNVYELIQQLARYDAETDVKFVALTNPHTYELEDFDGEEEFGVATVPGRQLDMYVKSIHDPTEGGPVHIRIAES